jgi:hypothetical protein
MKAFRPLVFALLTFALSSCTATWPDKAPKVCPRHYQILQSRTMFAASADTHVDPSEEYLDVATRVGDNFPYCIPFSFSPERTSTFTTRYRVRYCPACELGMDLALAKPKFETRNRPE